jgi:hypothetical protein
LSPSMAFVAIAMIPIKSITNPPLPCRQAPAYLALATSKLAARGFN